MKKNYVSYKNMKEAVQTILESIPEKDRIDVVRNIVDDATLDMGEKLKRISQFVKVYEVLFPAPSCACDEEPVEPVIG